MVLTPARARCWPLLLGSMGRQGNPDESECVASPCTRAPTFTTRWSRSRAFLAVDHALEVLSQASMARGRTRKFQGRQQRGLKCCVHDRPELLCGVLGSARSDLRHGVEARARGKR